MRCLYIFYNKNMSSGTCCWPFLSHSHGTASWFPMCARFRVASLAPFPHAQLELPFTSSWFAKQGVADIDMKGLGIHQSDEAMQNYGFLLGRLRLVLVRIDFKRRLRLLSASGYSSRKRLSHRPSLYNLYSG